MDLRQPAALPLTRSLLDARVAAGPAAVSMVNLGRGAHVVDAELLAALGGGHLHPAVLDVFNAESSPAGHAHW